MSFMHRQSLSLHRLDEENEREYQIWCSSFLIIVATLQRCTFTLNDALVTFSLWKKKIRELQSPYVFFAVQRPRPFSTTVHILSTEQAKNSYHDRLKIALYIFQNFSCKTQQSQQRQLKLHLGSSRDFKQRQRERKNITEMSLNKLIIWSWVDRRDQPWLLFVGLQTKNKKTFSLLHSLSLCARSLTSDEAGSKGD